MNDSALAIAPQPQLNITPIPNIPRSFFQLNDSQFQRIQLMAEMYAMSSFNAGDDKRTKGDYFIIMVKGMELGLSLTAAVEFINVIKGKPVTDGKGMLALIRGSGKCKSILIDSQDTACTVTMERLDGDKHTETWTIQDAQKFMVYEKGGWIPLANRKQWQSQPKTMLKWRAVAACARVLFPDVIGGMYTREEMADGEMLVQDDGTMTGHASLPMTFEPEPPVNWWEADEALAQLAIRCFDNKFIEKQGAEGVEEMATLIYPKTWSDFASRAEAAIAIRDAAEALKAEIAHQTEQPASDQPAPEAEPTPAPDEPPASDVIRGNASSKTVTFPAQGSPLVVKEAHLTPEEIAQARKDEAELENA